MPLCIIQLLQHLLCAFAMTLCVNVSSLHLDLLSKVLAQDAGNNCTDAHHTCCNKSSRLDPLEDTIDSEHTCRNCVHADRSDWLNSYGTFQPIGPNLRRSCTIECRKHITNRSCRQSCLFTASSISCKYRPCSGTSNTMRTVTSVKKC